MSKKSKANKEPKEKKDNNETPIIYNIKKTFKDMLLKSKVVKGVYETAFIKVDEVWKHFTKSKKHHKLGEEMITIRSTTKFEELNNNHNLLFQLWFKTDDFKQYCKEHFQKIGKKEKNAIEKRKRKNNKKQLESIKSQLQEEEDKEEDEESEEEEDEDEEEVFVKERQKDKFEIDACKSEKEIDAYLTELWRIGNKDVLEELSMVWKQKASLIQKEWNLLKYGVIRAEALMKKIGKLDPTEVVNRLLQSPTKIRRTQEEINKSHIEEDCSTYRYLHFDMTQKENGDDDTTQLSPMSLLQEPPTEDAEMLFSLSQHK